MHDSFLDARDWFSDMTTVFISTLCGGQRRTLRRMGSIVHAKAFLDDSAEQRSVAPIIAK